jgi:hypothetical protein
MHDAGWSVTIAADIDTPAYQWQRRENRKSELIQRIALLNPDLPDAVCRMSRALSSSNQGSSKRADGKFKGGRRPLTTDCVKEVGLVAGGPRSQIQASPPAA